MSYKTVLVHLDTSVRAHPRLETALQLARRFDAHIVGLFAIFEPDPRAFEVMAGTAGYYEQHAAMRRERRGAIERLFHAELKRAGVPGEWIETTEPANVVVPRLARCADLVVVSQDDPGDAEAYVGDHFPETLILSSGRPVLLLPYTGFFAEPSRRSMVAWNGSREAARAVHDAMPLLKTAERVSIVSIDTDRGGAHGERIPGADIAKSLARHGVKAEISPSVGATDASAGELLLSRAADLNADLVVMGGYGHARWQELVLGGVTRTLLASMTVPVLMSH
ncbi:MULTISPECIES: universal stress protein [unclassified Caballeronia]|uniref:universal stress protein n=1 Tax=unclassified Caballeronia TaxID=2646786 RepID=UPI002863360C|nr:MULTISPECIES: universal stress protein [unclassified Caballeronia]MDR5777495.1 universal stress protein [Caballeronia sp. LZ002]MDR5798556.1 universal stress protein [Caballeronia sp. LZ001]MDR5852913.1 universal stress protein [Caballeronia sp. LZ003]